MGTAFRRSYKDKKTGKLKRVRKYSIKYQSSTGEWVTEPTDAVQKHIALRLLLERERQAQGNGAIPVLPSSPAVPAGQPLPMAEIIQHYLPYLRLRVKSTTLKVRQEYLHATLGRLAVTLPAELTPALVQKYVEVRLAAGIAPQTVNLEMRFLRRALAWACEQGFATENPLQSWRPLRERPVKKRRAMLPDEVQKLLVKSPVHRRVVYATFLAAGVRRSELMQLLITDLHLDRNLLIVRPEISKTGKLRRIFLPQGLVDTLREYLKQEPRRRRERQENYLRQVRQRLARHEEADRQDAPPAETLRAMEDHILAARSHGYLFANGRGLPIKRNNNLLREFRRDLRKAGIDPTGLDLHSMRHTCNTVLLQGGVKPAIVRARMGHMTARMTEVYTDVDALDQGGSTASLARLLGVADGEAGQGGADEQPAAAGQGLTLEEEEQLRPTPALLAEMVKRYPNVLIGRICQVSEMAVRKWLKTAGIVRPKRVIKPELPESQVALLRADLRAALAEEAAKAERKAKGKNKATDGDSEATEPPASRSA